MVKTKKLTPQLVVVVAGYTLFVLLVIATLIGTTIPFGIMLFNPRVIHVNVALFMIALTVGALLPALLGYIVGDHAVKSKSKLRHHFNGVLFGFLAFWFMTSLTFIIAIPESLATNLNVRMVLVNILPSLGVLVVSSVLAILHARSAQAKRDVIEYRPFIYTLIGSILVPLIWLAIGDVVAGTATVYSFVTLGGVLALGAVSYATLRKSGLSIVDKLAWSALAVSVLYVINFVILQLTHWLANYIMHTPSAEAQNLVGVLSGVLILAGWAVYLVFQARSLTAVKRR